MMSEVSILRIFYLYLFVSSINYDSWLNFPLIGFEHYLKFVKHAAYSVRITFSELTIEYFLYLLNDLTILRLQSVLLVCCILKDLIVIILFPCRLLIFPGKLVVDPFHF